MRQFRLMSLAVIAVLAVTVLAGCKPKPVTTGAPSAKDMQKNAGDMIVYETKHGMIKYELTGTQTGTEELYFDNDGNRQAVYTNTTLSYSGIVQKTNSVTITDPEWIYTYDPETLTGTKIPNVATDIAKNADAKNLTRVGMDMLEQMGAVKIGTDTIAGKTCDVWEIKSLGSTVCVWNGLTLKVSSSIAGITITKTATEVSTSAPSQDKFKLPSNVTFTEQQNPLDMLKDMKQKMGQ